MYIEPDINDQIISWYGREEAVSDGVLIDVSDTAQKAGIIYPVAITKTIWERYINFSDKDDRLWNLLWEFRVKALHNQTDQLSFNMSFEVGGRKELVMIWAICSPGDLLEPVITIMLPEDY